MWPQKKAGDDFNPNVTQKVLNALYDAGRADLVDAIQQAGLKDLEFENHLLKKRVTALEQEKVNWLTRTGMFLELKKAKAAEALQKKKAWTRYLKHTVLPALAIAAWEAIKHFLFK
jgi:hypothetical protein